MPEFDEICQEIRELLVDSRGILKKEVGFDYIANKLHTHSRGTISLHLKEHLLKPGFISRDFDRKYTWNVSQQFSFTPTIQHTLYKFELTLKPQKSHSTTTLQFQNHIENPLPSYCWYFTSIKPATWEELSPEITLEYNGDKYLLSNKIDFLEPNNPFHHNFMVKFPFSLPKDKPATLIFKNQRNYSIDFGFINLFPEETTQKIEFILNCPTKNLQLRVWHINKKTGVKYGSPHNPIKHGKTITWQNTSHNLEEYYQFEWIG